MDIVYLLFKSDFYFSNEFYYEILNDPNLTLLFLLIFDVNELSMSSISSSLNIANLLNKKFGSNLIISPITKLKKPAPRHNIC